MFKKILNKWKSKRRDSRYQRRVDNMEYSYCVLGATWGPHKGNNGGFIIQYGIKNFGFGEVTFVIEKDGSLTCDTETCPRAFVERCLMELLKRAKLRDPFEDQAEVGPIIKSDNKHGRREEEIEEIFKEQDAKIAMASQCYKRDENTG